MSATCLPKKLPLESFEEAYPLLRRPYFSAQVYGKLQTTPRNPAEPCAISLYTIGETLFDRFNLFCGSAWDHDFQIKRESKGTASNGRSTRFYCEIEATIILWGDARTDIGEGVALTRAGAEMNARAQAYKRAGRKFGPGQCLYSCDEILMLRGGDGENRLCVPDQGDDRWLHPFFDLDGTGRRYVRSRYQAWLNEYGKEIYGEPLDHLALASILESSPHARTVVVPITIPRETSPLQPSAEHARSLVAAAAPIRASGSQQNGHTAPAQGNGRASEPASGSPQGRPPAKAHDFLPMADHPAPIAAIRAAGARGYGQDAARALCNLVRGEEQDEHVSRQQLGTVENWLTMLHNLGIPEEALLSAAGHNANRRTTQERRQALFSRWLARKAAGEQPKAAQGDGVPAESPPEQPEPHAGAAGQPGKEDPAELAQVMTELQNRMGEHDFGERPVARLAALALGRGPNSRVKMADLGTAMVRALTDLLDCAAAIGWNSDRLDHELLEAHGADQHSTASGRFSAFANTLKDLAESRGAGHS
jgi:hypothetical protein